MASTYGLYQTFSSDIPNEKLKVKEKKQIEDSFHMLSSKQTEAVFMLIYEWARVNDALERSDVLPYEMKEKNGKVIFDLEKLPTGLQWVLWRFSNVVKDKK